MYTQCEFEILVLICKNLKKKNKKQIIPFIIFKESIWSAALK